jgi:phosphoserine phosphatase RsbU/P
MRAAARIQASILPRDSFDKELQLAVRYAPMTAVAGDLYDFPAIRPDSIGIFVADVAGAWGSGNTYRVDGKDRSYHANWSWRRTSESHRSLEFQTLPRGPRAVRDRRVYMLNEANRVGRYSVAGHPPPLLWRRSTQALHKLNETGLLLGVRLDEAYTETEFTVMTGDRLLLYNRWSFGSSKCPAPVVWRRCSGDFIDARQGLAAEPLVEELLREVLDCSRESGQPRQLGRS